MFKTKACGQQHERRWVHFIQPGCRSVGDFKLLVSSFLCLVLQGCGGSEPPKVQRWYEGTKAAILQQCEQRIDSSHRQYSADSLFMRVDYFAQGVRLRADLYQSGKLAAQTCYSADGRFELRREGCEDGRIAFEGLVYEDEFYGLSRWWHCNGLLAEQGMRFRSLKMGRWEYYNRLGELVKTEYHGPTDSLDFLPVLWAEGGL